MRNEGLSRNDPERRKDRQHYADRRQHERNCRTDEEQLESLDRAGHAAKKERAKLALRIAAKGGK